MEYLDIYDINRRKTNITKVRGTKLSKGEYRLVVHICIFNSKGEMLIQRRQTNLKSHGGLWDMSAGGGVKAGLNSQEAAQSELLEELGLDVDMTDILPHITINFETGFNDIYVIERDVDLSQLKLQEEEVMDAKWATQEEIMDMIDKGEFINYYKSLMDFIFVSRKKYGVYD